MSTTVVQSGESNSSDVSQASSVSVINIDQSGNSNESDVDQTFGTRGSLVNVTQIGDSNTSKIEQSSDGPGNPPFSFATSATVAQNGVNDQSTITQQAAGATAFVTQIGAVDGNVSTITQDGLSDDPLLGNSATVLQDGDLNQSTIIQFGTELTADITQTGDGNFSMLTQNGSDNSFTLTQDGGDSSTVTQSGSGNSATVNQ